MEETIRCLRLRSLTYFQQRLIDNVIITILTVQEQNRCNNDPQESSGLYSELELTRRLNYYSLKQVSFDKKKTIN